MNKTHKNVNERLILDTIHFGELNNFFLDFITVTIINWNNSNKITHKCYVLYQHKQQCHTMLEVTIR